MNFDIRISLCLNKGLLNLISIPFNGDLTDLTQLLDNVEGDNEEKFISQSII